MQGQEKREDVASGSTSYTKSESSASGVPPKAPEMVKSAPAQRMVKWAPAQRMVKSAPAQGMVKSAPAQGMVKS